MGTVKLTLNEQKAHKDEQKADKEDGASVRLPSSMLHLIKIVRTQSGGFCLCVMIEMNKKAV